MYGSGRIRISYRSGGKQFLGAGLAREAGRPWIADESFARMRN